MPISNGHLLIIANVYGWTNGHTSKEAAKRTNYLLQCVIAEFEALPPGPKLLVGDLNGEPQDFASLQAAVDNHLLVDIGAHPGFSQPVEAPTCFTHNGSPSRRDYMFANIGLVEAIKSMEVSQVDTISTHRLLRLSLTFNLQSSRVTKLRSTSSITSYLTLAMRSIYKVPDGQDPSPKQIQEGRDMLQEHITNAFDKQASMLDALVDAKDTNALWSLWTKTLLAACISGIEVLQKRAFHHDDSPQDPQGAVSARPLDTTEDSCTAPSLQPPQSIGQHSTRLAPEFPKLCVSQQSVGLACSHTCC